MTCVDALPLHRAGKTLRQGTAGVGYRQNMVFDKNAFALAMVPLISPPGANNVSRKSYKGTSVRLIPTYDGTNDRSNFRLDVLYGVKAIDGAVERGRAAARVHRPAARRLPGAREDAPRRLAVLLADDLADAAAAGRAVGAAHGVSVDQ